MTVRDDESKKTRPEFPHPKTEVPVGLLISCVLDPISTWCDAGLGRCK